MPTNLQHSLRTELRRRAFLFIGEKKIVRIEDFVQNNFSKATIRGYLVEWRRLELIEMMIGGCYQLTEKGKVVYRNFHEFGRAI